MRDSVVNAMTVDVEDWFHVQALSSVIGRDSWDTRQYRVQANTEKLLQLFDDRKVKATFFVLGWVAERSPGLVRKIAALGHEVACHGYSHTLVFNQTPPEFREETIRSKRIIEDVAGCGVTGYRASTYSITSRSLWALDILVEQGFQYDSSIFPVRHDVYGIPGAGRFPGRIPTPSGASIVEFPMSTARFLGMHLPVCGGGYFRLLPFTYTRLGLDQIVRGGNPFVFYLHPWEVDPGQPRVGANWLSRLRHYTNLSRTMDRLTRLIQRYPFGTMRAVLNDAGLLCATPPAAADICLTKPVAVT